MWKKCITLLLFSILGLNIHAQTGLIFSPELREEFISAPTTPAQFILQNPTNTWLKTPETAFPSAAPHAFFCRLEWNLEKKVKMPIRFRLGDVEYVDRLEGKRRTY